MIIFRIVWLWVLLRWLLCDKRKKLTITSCRHVIFSNFLADTRNNNKKDPLLIQGAWSHMVSDQGFYYVFEQIRWSDFPWFHHNSPEDLFQIRSLDDYKSYKKKARQLVNPFICLEQKSSELIKSTNLPIFTSLIFITK